MIIRSPYGMRLILCSNTESDWKEGTWRCVNMLDGQSIPPPEKNTYPGVRIPDLDLFDEPESTRADEDLVSTYPIVSDVKEGNGWTFGGVSSAKLKNNVHLIIVERIGQADMPPASEREATVRAILKHLHAEHPAALASVQRIAFQSLREEREKRSLQKWIDANLKD